MKTLCYLVLLLLFQSCSSIKQVAVLEEEIDYIALEGKASAPVSHTIFDTAEEEVLTPEVPQIAVHEENVIPEFGTYIVQLDDNLGYIALQLLGKRTEWRTLQKWNPKTLANPRVITAGMEIKYQYKAITKPRPVNDGEFLIYIVEKKDTLARIAHKLLGDGSRWELIKKWNPGTISKNNVITRGMQLKYQVVESTRRAPASETQTSEEFSKYRVKRSETRYVPE